MNSKLPPPTHTNDESHLKNSNGGQTTIKILDEIIHRQRGYKNKAIYLQLMRLKNDGGKEKTEMRLCYYININGRRGRKKDRWVFGRNALIIPKSDFEMIISEAKKREWIT
jgi:hypothetical protein